MPLKVSGAAWPRAPLARLLIYAPRRTRWQSLLDLTGNDAMLDEVCERAAECLRPGIYAEWTVLGESCDRTGKTVVLLPSAAVSPLSSSPL